MKFTARYLFSEYKGREIAYLKPVSESDVLAKDGSKQWNFECVCGKIITVPPYRVISGHLKSCGCMRYKNNVRKGVPQGPRENPKVDLSGYIGRKENRLTVIGYERPSGKGRWRLKCECECGNIVYVLPYLFDNEDVKSCGCIRGEKRKTHGLSHTKLYQEWFQMVSRCHNPKAQNYERYGGRGITVCDEWRESPTAFADWVASVGGKPKGTTLERIDNNGPYAPWNCRFATMKEQSRNKRSNRMITYNGKTQCLMDWAIELGLSFELLRNRLGYGWSVERAFTEPINKEYSHPPKRKATH